MYRGSWKLSFLPELWGYNSRVLWEVHCGYGVGRDGRPEHRPCLRGDCAGVLPTPAGGVVVTVGCTTLQMWRDGVPLALQVRVLRAPDVAGCAVVPDPPGRSAGVRTKEVLRVTRRSRTPRGGRSGPPAASDGHPSSRGRVATPDPSPSRRRVRGHTCDEVESGRPELAE